MPSNPNSTPNIPSGVPQDSESIAAYKRGTAYGESVINDPGSQQLPLPRILTEQDTLEPEEQTDQTVSEETERTKIGSRARYDPGAMAELAKNPPKSEPVNPRGLTPESQRRQAEIDEADLRAAHKALERKRKRSSP